MMHQRLVKSEMLHRENGSERKENDLISGGRVSESSH